MEKETIALIINTLPKGRTVFYSFADRYACMLLAYQVGKDGCEISQLKKTRYAPLLKRPMVKAFLSGIGKSTITADDLLSYWPVRPEAYRLTLGTWPGVKVKPDPGWHQITRRGWNLALQLNLPVSHRRELSKLVPDWKSWVEHTGHPVAGNGELTLAWARIDLDLETGEALIEEIQSDWVRDARSNARWYKDDEECWQTYYEEVLLPKIRQWSETMLCATIWFLVEELGIKTIFYHTHESGCELKRMDKDWRAPRSLYSDLPKRFCFDITYNGPLFIRDSADKKLQRIFTEPRTKWFVLDLTPFLSKDNVNVA